MTGAGDKGAGRIEALFDYYRAAVIPAGAGPVQVRECRLAFFAGSMASFYSIFSALREGEGPTEAEMAFIAAIDSELREFGEQFEVRHLPPEGSA